jgi:hypothetical protein
LALNCSEATQITQVPKLNTLLPGGLGQGNKISLIWDLAREGFKTDMNLLTGCRASGGCGRHTYSF